MHAVRTPHLFSGIPIRILIFILTSLSAFLPLLIGGLLLHSRTEAFVINNYMNSLSDVFGNFRVSDSCNAFTARTQLEDKMSGIIRNYSFTLYLLDGSDRVLSEKSYWYEKNHDYPFPLSPNALEESKRSADKTYFYRDPYRGNLIYVYATLSNRLSAVGIFQTSQFSGKVLWFWDVILWMFAAILALLLGANAVFQKQITLPLKQLLYRINNPSLPVLSPPCVQWNNEIGQLYRAYEKRMEEFGQSLKQINQLNDRKRKSEMEVLQNQINSHFIYNTLNNIQWLASAGRTEDVIATVKALDSLLRACSRTEEFVTIEEELSYAEAYLTAQKIRFNDVFDFQFDVDIMLLQMQIPKFILQPIVENSIYHGFLNCNRKNGIIRISLSRRGHRIDIRVYDNGIGIEEDRILAVLSNQYISSGRYMGVALGNINRRIRLLCGREYGIGLESEYGKYTVVEITVPLLL